MKKTGSPNTRFQCQHCHQSIEIASTSIIDKKNPELNLAMEGWFVLFPPQDWLSAWNGQVFCAFDCLSSWVKTIENDDPK